MARISSKLQALRSAISSELHNLYQRQVPRDWCEALESRTLFNAGGGWIGTGTGPGGGIVGVYYPSTLATGTTSFTRTDVRIDFTNTTYASGATSGQEMPGGGLPNDPNFGAVPGTAPVPSNGFAVDWSGLLTPKYSEYYTFEVYGTSNDSSTLIINGTTLATGAGNHTASYRMTAGQTYTAALDYVHSPSATWKMQLHWSSTGLNPFPEEAIEPAAPVAGNLPSPEGLDGAGFGNAANDAQYMAKDGYGPLQDPETNSWITGTVTSSSTIITGLSHLANAQGVMAAIGQWVEAPGLPAGDTITGVNPLNDSVTVATAATASGTGVYVLLDAAPPLDSNGDPEGDFDLPGFDGAQNNQGLFTLTFNGAASVSNKYAQNETVGIKENFLSGFDALNTFSATVTSGSTTITGVADASLFYPTENVFGVGIPSPDSIASVNPATNTITLNTAATSSSTGSTTLTTYVEGQATAGSAVLTTVFNLGASNWYVGATVSGTGIPAGTTIASLNASAETVTLSATVSTTTRTTLVMSQPENTLTYYPYSNNMPVGAMGYDSTNSTGTGYNPNNNTTTILFLNSGGWDNVNFANTDRNGYGAPGGSTTATTGGIANLRILTPTTQAGMIDYGSNSVFTTQYLSVFAPYAAIRDNSSAWNANDPGSAAGTDWSTRPLPASWNFAANVNQDYTPDEPNLSPWEEQILLSNETGKDLYIDLPASASSNYITSLATLIQKGESVYYTYSGNVTSGSATITGFSSNENLFVGEPISGTGIPAGTTIAAFSVTSTSLTTITLSHAATANQSQDVLTLTDYYPGLLPNLNIYIEYGNEIWNGDQGGAALDLADGNVEKNSTLATDTTDWTNYVDAGGTATVQQSINLNSAFNQTGIYSATSTFGAGGGIDDKGDAFIGGEISSAFATLTARSDDTSVGFTLAPNTTGDESITTGSTNNREDFTVPTGTSITVDDLQAFAGAGTSLGTTSSTEVPVAIWQISSTSPYTLVGSGPVASGTLSSTDSTEIGNSGYYQLTSFAPVTLTGGYYAAIAQYPANFAFYNSNISGATATVSDSSGLIGFPADDGITANSNDWYYLGSSYGTSTTWTAPGATSATNAYGAAAFSFNSNANVVSAQGQTFTIATPGSYNALIVDATSTNGYQQAQPFVVHYTNGSTATFSQTMSDWTNPLSPYTFTANTSAGSTTLTSATGISNLFANEWVTGPGIPSGTTITTFSTAGGGTVTLSAAATATAAGVTITPSAYSGVITGGSTIVTGVNYTAGLFDGEIISRPEIPAGTTIVSFSTAPTNTITLSAAPTSGYTTAVALLDGESITSTSPSYVTYTGADVTGPRYIYTYSFALNNTWTVASVTVPTNSNIKIMSMTLQTTNPNAPGNVISLNQELWDAIRTQDASAIFRAVYGGASMPVTSATSSYPNSDTLNPDPRIRPVYEQQQDDNNNSLIGYASDTMNNVDYELSQNANYYLYGIGAGWYTDDNDPTTSVSTLYADSAVKESLSTAIGGLNASDAVLIEAQTAAEFGLRNVGYEGGFDLGAGNQDATEASAATVSTAATYMTNSLDQFYEAGGTLPIVYEIIDDGYKANDGWAVQTSMWNTTERLQGIEAAEAALPPTTLPAGWTTTVIGGANYSSNYFGTLTSGSATITGIETAGLVTHATVTGAGIASGSTITSIVANVSITLSHTVTTSATNEQLSIVSPQGNNLGVAGGPTPLTDTWTLSGENPSGTGFGSGGQTSDEYFLASTPVSGNATISAELTGLATASSGNDYPNAGLVMRTSASDPSAPTVALVASGNAHAFYMSARSSEGGAMSGQSFVTSALTAPENPIQITGSISTSSDLITGVSGLSLPEIGQVVSGSFIPAGTTISTWSTASGVTTVTLSSAATNTVANITLDVIFVPVYMKLSESTSGAYDDFTGYISSNGTSWTTVGTISITSTAFSTSSYAAGLFEDSEAIINSRNSQFIATFSNVTAPYTAIDLPSGYNSTGDQSYSPGTSSLREDFTVPSGSTLTIDNLEAFAGAGSTLGTTAASEVTVQVWATSGGNALVGTGAYSGISATFSSTDSTSLGSDGYYDLDSFTPQTLPAGNYALIATFPANFSYYNSNIANSTQTIYNGRGAITFPIDDGTTANANLWYYDGTSYSSSTTWTAPGGLSLLNAYGNASIIFNATY